MRQNVRIFEPVAARNQPRRPRRALDCVGGKVIGFIDNAKPNFNYLVDDLAELLVTRHGATAIIKRRKIRAGIPASGAVMQELAQHCDAVITGSGD